MLTCEDSGAVTVWSNINGAWNQWKEEISVAEHDNAALAVECLELERLYVTAGADGNAKV